MPATSRKYMRTEELLQFMLRSGQRVRNAPRALLSIIVLAFLLASGCAPSPSSSPEEGTDTNSPSSASNNLPELTEEMIRDRINDAFIREVPEENAAAEPISWSFDENEPKEITVVEKQMDGARATIVLDIKTRSAPNMRNPRALEGQIRTKWQLRTGWVLRKWEIVETENISMKYKNLPKPPAQNSNR